MTCKFFLILLLAIFLRSSGLLQICLPNEVFLKLPNWEEVVFSLLFFFSSLFPSLPLSLLSLFLSLPACLPKGIFIFLGIYIIPSIAALCLPVYLTDLQNFIFHLICWKICVDWNIDHFPKRVKVVLTLFLWKLETTFKNKIPCNVKYRFQCRILVYEIIFTKFNLPRNFCFNV